MNRDVWQFTDVTLTCGHVRPVETGLLAMIRRRPLPALWCGTCKIQVAIKDTP